MGRICCIVGCSSSTYQIDKWHAQLCEVHGLKFGSCICEPPFYLYPFPSEKKDPISRKRWIRLVNRKNKKGGNWQPTYQDRICSIHFKEKKPTLASPDPTENLGYDCGTKLTKCPRAAPKERPEYQIVVDQRTVKRKRKKEAAHTITQPVDEPIADHDIMDEVCNFTSMEEEHERQTISNEAVLHDHQYVSNYKELPNKEAHSPDQISSSESSKKDCSGCHDKEARILELEEGVRKLDTKLKQCKKKKKSKYVTYNITSVVWKSDATVNEYTGIQSKQKLQRLHSYLKPRVSKMRYWTGQKKESSPRASPRVKLKRTPKKPGPERALTTEQELILVLMKLRLALTYSFLAGLFGIAQSTVSAIFNTWIKFLASELCPLINWPDKMSIFSKMPKSLARKYKHLRCTIDCTEIFIERPRQLANQAETWSDYKKHNTVKFLVGITPNGMISFLSNAWGGRASDVVITRESGFLDLIDPGDTILADRGFIIKEDLLYRGAQLYIPPPSKGKEQQAPEDVAKTKKIANARIHVERAIGRIKWFAILRQTLPISLVPLVDDIVVVCAALVNLRQVLVKDDEGKGKKKNKKK